MPTILTYSHSPLFDLSPYYQMQESVQIFDEKFEDFSSLKDKEIWLDSYIDLFNPQSNNIDFLYRFFLRLHKILLNFPKSSIRILRNFHYETKHPQFKQKFQLIQQFLLFFKENFPVYFIYIPDIITDSYTYHPYNLMKFQKNSQAWNSASMLRIIKSQDLISNLFTDLLPKDDIIVAGQKISLLDMATTIYKIFGITTIFESEYSFLVHEKIKGKVLADIYYNFEAICISDL